MASSTAHSSWGLVVKLSMRASIERPSAAKTMVAPGAGTRFTQTATLISSGLFVTGLAERVTRTPQANRATLIAGPLVTGLAETRTPQPNRAALIANTSRRFEEEVAGQLVRKQSTQAFMRESLGSKRGVLPTTATLTG